MSLIVVVCTAVVIIWTLLLAFWTSIERGRSKEIYYGAVLDPASAMAKAQRAHGNAAEHAGVVIGLFLLTGLVYGDRDLGVVVTALVIAITAGRIIHALGILTSRSLERIHLFKVIGASATYFGGIALAGMVAAKAL